LDSKLTDKRFWNDGSRYSMNFMFYWLYTSIYAHNETNLMHYLSCLFSYYTSTCFALASCPSGGNNVYMQQFVCVILKTGMFIIIRLPTCHICFTFYNDM
jgi:hypothetical protein